MAAWRERDPIELLGARLRAAAVLDDEAMAAIDGTLRVRVLY